MSWPTDEVLGCSWYPRIPLPRPRGRWRESARGLPVVAVAWASSPWAASYHRIFSKDVHHLVNDQLMAIFFLVRP